MKRNIAKAIKIADILVAAHIKNSLGLEEISKDMNASSRDLGLEIAKVHRDVAKCIQMISDTLQEKPKKRRKIANSNS